MNALSMRSLVGAAVVGVLGLAIGYWLGATAPSGRGESQPAPGTATAQIASLTPNPTPRPTLSPAFREFLTKYVAVRQKYWDGLFAILPALPNTQAENTRYFGQRSGEHIKIRFEFEKLPRTAETRDFIEAALRAVETGLAADGLMADAYRLRGSPSSSESTQWFSLSEDADRMWRVLDDKIEDVLVRFGETWPGFSRPLVPR